MFPKFSLEYCDFQIAYRRKRREKQRNGEEIDDDELNYNSSQFYFKNEIQPAKGSIEDHYAIGPSIAFGAFGEVQSIIHKKTHKIYAVKKVLKRNKFEESLDDIFNEVRILRKLNDHENILKFHEYYEDKKHFYIVTDYCKGGALYDEIHFRGKFQEIDAAILIKYLLRGLSHCHKNNIVHRDLKPENICFLDQRKSLTKVKIIDFGTAVAITDDMVLRAKRGSVFYLAPEVLLKNYGPKCDLWSLGCITYCLLSGFPPFNGASDLLITEKVKKGEYSFDKNVWR